MDLPKYLTIDARPTGIRTRNAYGGILKKDQVTLSVFVSNYTYLSLAFMSIPLFLLSLSFTD